MPWGHTHPLVSFTLMVNCRVTFSLHAGNDAFHPPPLFLNQIVKIGGSGNNTESQANQVILFSGTLRRELEIRT